MLRLKNILCAVVVLCLLTTACKKSEYLTDEGVHNTVTELSTYDYLKQHPWKLFDSLVMMIDHYNLKEEVNKAGTVFAPTNYSVSRFVAIHKQGRDENLPYTMDTLYKVLAADSIRQYLFAEKISLSSASLNVTPLTSAGKTTCAVQRVLQTSTEYSQWGRTPVYSLYFIRVKGNMDDPGVPPVPGSPDADVRILCQTTNINTSSGATWLHVLANTHVFNRF